MSWLAGLSNAQRRHHHKVRAGFVVVRKDCLHTFWSEERRLP